MRERHKERVERHHPAPIRTSQHEVSLGNSFGLRSGQALEPEIRTALEPRFGHDFSKVRIHADERAGRVTDEFGARALTVGSDIAFAPGEYDPQNPFLRHVLTHELAHVVQNERFAGDFRHLESKSAQGDGAESEAFEAASRATRGFPVQLNAAPSALVSTWPDWLDDAIDSTQSFGNRVVDGAQNLAGRAVNAGQSIANGAIDSGQAVVGGLVDSGQSLANRAVDSVQSLANRAVDGGQSLLAHVPGMGGVNSLIDRVQNGANSFVDRAQVGANSGLDWLQSGAGGLVDRAQSGANNTVDAAQSGAGGLVDRIQGGANSLIDTGQRFGHALGQEGLSAILDPSGAMDRQRAQEELRGRFNLVGEDFVGPHLPNQITEEEFRDVARTYSNIRMGRGDLTINASELGTDPAGTYGMTEAQYRERTMADIATMMTTAVGRREVMGLSNSTMRDDAGNARNSLFGFELPQLPGDLDSVLGSPMHHHTTIRPLHQELDGEIATGIDADGDGVLSGDGNRSNDNANALDYTNAIADWGNNEADTYRRADGSRGRGTDVDLRINPGRPITGTTTPSDVVMAHEMAHVLHETQGTMAPSTLVTAADGVPADVGMFAEYEHQAAGLGRHASDPNTENAYRRERNLLGAGLPIRTSYSVLP